MGDITSKGNGILLLALCLNLVLTLLSVGYLGYAVYTLDRRVKYLEKDTAKPKLQNTEKAPNRNARSVGQVSSALICQQLKDSCVKLCGQSLLVSNIVKRSPNEIEVIKSWSE